MNNLSRLAGLPSPAPRERVPEGEARRRMRVGAFGKTLTRLATLATLSRSAGEGVLAAAVLACALMLPLPAQAALLETPIFEADVAQGKLPPVANRIPREPSLAELETIGRPGGELRMLMASPKDTRLMVVYGYARLVAYTPALALVPDILERIDIEDG